MDLRRLLLGVAAHGLASSVALPERPLTDAQWRRLRDTVSHQRITGLAMLAADDGALVVDAGQRAALEEDHLEALAHVLRLERMLLELHDVLTEAEVPFAVLKGSAVAHLDYVDPSLRTFGDNDLLLPTDRLAAGLAALREHGYVRPAAEIAPGFDVRFGKGATLRDPASGHELDIHRTLAMGPFGLLIRLEELWADPTSFELGGRRLVALGAEQRCLHACFHATIGNSTRRVLPYRDVAEMVLYGQGDADRLLGLARSWGAEAVVARAVADTWDALELADENPLVTWARGRVPSRREERLLGVYGQGASYAAKAVAGLAVLPTWRDRADYVRLLTVPRGASLEARGRSRLDWLVRGGRRLARDARRSRARS